MTLKHQVNKPAEFVFQYLTDMQKFVSIHPIISKIDSLGENKYLIHETLKLGFIPYSFTYPATIESNPNTHTINMKAVVSNMVHIEMRFAIQSHSSSSIVEEEILIKSIFPVEGLIKSLLRKYHSQLFKNIGLTGMQ